MNTQKYHFAIVVLLLGVVLLPVTTASQSADRDLGIVRLRYVTIVVRNYDEALKWYTNVLEITRGACACNDDKVIFENPLNWTTRSFIFAKQREYENGPPTREPSGETIVRGRDRGKRKEAEFANFGTAICR